MLLVSDIQSNKLNFGAQLLMLVFITVKPTSSYAVVFQSRKRVLYYRPALEIHSIRGAAGTIWHIIKGSSEHINNKYCILIKFLYNSNWPKQNQQWKLLDLVYIGFF